MMQFAIILAAGLTTITMVSAGPVGSQHGSGGVTPNSKPNSENAPVKCVVGIYDEKKKDFVEGQNKLIGPNEIAYFDFLGQTFSARTNFECSATSVDRQPPLGYFILGGIARPLPRSQ